MQSPLCKLTFQPPSFSPWRPQSIWLDSRRSLWPPNRDAGPVQIPTPLSLHCRGRFPLNLWQLLCTHTLNILGSYSCSPVCLSTVLIMCQCPKKPPRRRAPNAGTFSILSPKALILLSSYQVFQLSLCASPPHLLVSGEEGLAIVCTEHSALHSRYLSIKSWLNEYMKCVSAKTRNDNGNFWELLSQEIHLFQEVFSSISCPLAYVPMYFRAPISPHSDQSHPSP